MIYLAKSSREGRLLRSCKNSHKSSAEMLKTSYRHSLSSLAGFLMVLYWFSKNKQRKKQKCTASELKLETTYIAVQWEKCFFFLGCFLFSTGAHRTSIMSLLHGEQDYVKLELP